MDEVDRLFERYFEIAAKIDDMSPGARHEARDDLLRELDEIKRAAHALPRDQAKAKESLSDLVGASRKVLGAGGDAGVEMRDPPKLATEDATTVPKPPVSRPPGDWYPTPDPGKSPHDTHSAIQAARKAQLAIVNHVLAPPLLSADDPTGSHDRVVRWDAALWLLIGELCEAEQELIVAFAEDAATAEDRARWEDWRSQIRQLQEQAQQVQKAFNAQMAETAKALAEFNALTEERKVTPYGDRWSVDVGRNQAKDRFEASKIKEQELNDEYLKLMEQIEALKDSLRQDQDRIGRPLVQRATEPNRFTLHCPKDQRGRTRDDIIKPLLGDELFQTAYVEPRFKAVQIAGRAFDGDEEPDEKGDELPDQSPQPDAPERQLLTDDPNLFQRLFRGLSPLWWLIILLVLLGLIGFWIMDDDSVEAPGEEGPASASTAAQSDTGINVAVADTFGPQGLRVAPAPGVKIQVLNPDGDVLAEALTPDDLDGVFIALSPGDYVLTLDVGDYEEALPPQCTDGYRRDFDLSAGERLDFAASVYTTRIADDGTTVSPSEGDCIRLR